MKNNIFLLGSLMGVALLVGCARKEVAAPAAPVPQTDVVATVNGKAITRPTFDYYVRTATNGKGLADVTDEQRQQLLDALVRSAVVAEQAEKDGLQKESGTAAALDLARFDILQQSAAQKYLRDKQPTDEELRKEYDAQLAGMQRGEYRAHHIQVATEDFARTLIRQLQRGGRFEDIAKKESMDAGTKEKGGDLGDWVRAGSVDPAFADALKGLKKGEITQSPVQTQFGWHIIRLDDVREQPAPAFDATREQLAQIVMRKKFLDYTNGLLKGAKVEKKL